MNRLKKRLGKEWIFCDGGIGTMLQNMGLSAGEMPERWNLTHSESVLSLHAQYLEAGCDVINTNTFGLNALKFGDQVEAIAIQAVELAKQARILTKRPDAWIALDIGPSGKLLEPMGDLSFEEAVTLFAQVIRAGSQAGADLIFIETMSDSYESKAAVLAAKENCDLPIMITNTYDEDGTTMTGGTVESMVALLEGLGVDALGLNCGMGPQQMLPVVRRLVVAASIPVIVNPNAGLPTQIQGRTVYDLKAEMFAQSMKEIAQMGVHVVGGCCGTTPEYIRRTIDRVKEVAIQPVVKKHRTLASSASRVVEIGSRPVIIGERINPTGKKRFQQALRDNDLNYILTEALNQEDAGAHVLDVNVGLPEIDEPERMQAVIQQLQGVTSLPLQIDTSDADALEKALRIYNGKPMVNSVSGKKESMDVVFPLVKKYGGVIVGLTLDENGIPETAAGRLRIAAKIYAQASAYGIEPENLVIDGLAMTISSNSDSAAVTLETLRQIRDTLHGHTLLGISNISFGLPHREIINSHFFTMAIANGLSCAIINPLNEAMMRAYRASCALLGMDPQCMDYIETYAKVPDATAGIVRSETSSTMNESPLTIKESVERGLTANARQMTLDALRSREGLDIINQELIPALDVVGKGFEGKTIFLPQLLMSAEAAKASFEVIKTKMAGPYRQSKGKIVLATVKGDIHDIGKNIVKVMLENYGYEVLDLGKDVDPERIVATAMQQHVRLVGLSALMTTTVVSMEQTIQLLKQKQPDIKVIVGGAVMTQDYADQIGADAYAADAMETVRYADALFHNQ